MFYILAIIVIIPLTIALAVPTHYVSTDNPYLANIQYNIPDFHNIQADLDWIHNHNSNPNVPNYYNVSYFPHFINPITIPQNYIDQASYNSPID